MLIRKGFLMLRSRWVLSLLTLSGLCLATGCQQADDDELSMPDFSVSKAPVPEAETKAEAVSDIEQVGRKEPPREGQLRFTLRPGAKFPLQKTVEQTLVQQLKDGKAISRSRLFTRFAISVDSEEIGKRRLSVRYDRVRYSQDMLGKKLEYDSANPGEQVPPEALLYHGMINNGFSFWLSDDNRVLDVEGMPEFLQRCARFVPDARRQQAMQQALANSEDESFANFVDDSIGLLRFNKDAPGRETLVKEGDEWSRNRKLTNPVPMALDTTYHLVSLTDKMAKIDVLGRIVPMRVASLGPENQRQSESEILLKDGHTAGVCDIDRETGLPIHSRIERNFAMRVRLADKSEFDQHKRVVTTVESFPSGKAIYTGQDDRPAEPGSEILPTSGIRNRRAATEKPTDELPFTPPRLP